MATTDLRRGTVGSRPAFSTVNRSWSESMVVDFSNNNSTIAGVTQLFNVPAGVRVEGIIWEVITAEGATLTFDIGDATDTDGYVDGANGNTAGSGTSQFQILTEAAPPTMGVVYGNGVFYAANGVISIITVNAAATAVISVTAYGVDGTPQTEA